MKFEKLNDTKIRIILSLKDMEANNISVESVLSNSTNSQKFLENIISRAEKELGFNPGNSELLVEAVAPSAEKCIFTITQIVDDCIYTNKSFNSFIFKFDKFEDFTNLCVFLNNFSYLDLKNFSKNFSLIFYNGTYYLKLVEEMKSFIILDYVKSLFEEFGKNVSNSISIDGLLDEYGKVIFNKNAILNCIKTFAKKI